VLASPQWAAADSLLPTDPGFVADCRQALADSLSLPCPEEPPPVSPEDLDLMQHYLHALNSAAAPQPATDNCLLKREKGGKKAGKIPHQSYLIYNLKTLNTWFPSSRLGTSDSLRSSCFATFFIFRIVKPPVPAFRIFSVSLG